MHSWKLLLSLRRDFRVFLSPKQCLTFIEEHADDSICKFPPLFFSGPYGFVKPLFRLRILRQPDFYLASRGWIGGCAINGHIIQDSDRSIVSAKMWPPPWVFILFWLVPVFILGKAFIHDPTSVGVLIVLMVWFFLAGATVISIIKTAVKLINNLEATLKSASTGSSEIGK